VIEHVTSELPRWGFDDTLVQLAGVAVYRTLLAGRFWFDSVTLAPGANVFTAIATDSSDNTSQPADPIAIIRDTPALPDLAAGPDDLFVHPIYPEPGARVTLSATVRNTGSAAASNVPVVFFALSESGPAVTLGAAQTIPVVPPGGEAIVPAEWEAGPAGRYRLVVVVDHGNAVLEALESNNRASREVVVSAGGAPTISVRTDRPTYAPDGTVLPPSSSSIPGGQRTSRSTCGLKTRTASRSRRCCTRCCRR
jgi:hypothetical protein